MRAGTMRERLQFSAFSATDDPRWGHQEGYAPYGQPVWGRVEREDSEEASATAGVQTGHRYRITIRYNAQVKGTDRITWRGRTLEIISAAPDERRTELRIIAREYPQAS